MKGDSNKTSCFAEQEIGCPDFKPKIILFSSCRLDGLLAEKSYIHEIHHTHNTKELIQYIQYINGDIDIDKEMHKYVFRSCFLKPDTLIDRDQLKKDFLSSDIICIELCSRKKYTKNGYFIHHLAADKGDAPVKNLIEESKSTEEYTLELQSKEEIEQDIVKICNMLNEKKLIFVTHIDYGIEKRKTLIDEVSEICNRHNIPYVNPSEKFKTLQKEMIDSNHYTPKGLKIVAGLVIEKLIDKNVLPP